MFIRVKPLEIKLLEEMCTRAKLLEIKTCNRRERHMKEYKYSRSTFVISSLGSLILMIGVMLWGLMGLIGDPHNYLYQLASYITPILLISTLISISNPDRITDDDETITFYGYGRAHSYKWNDLKNLRVKEFMITDRVLLRVGEQRILGGRYWINVDSLENGRQLLVKLKQYESILHPDAIKYTRRQPVGGNLK
jgi:hypothetical protein